jgi:ribosomal protein S18 acetylase RimI-like enzyme
MALSSTDSTRSATPQDVDVLVGLMREFYAESSYTLDEAHAASAFLKLLSQPELGGVWLAHRGGAAAGYVVLTLRYSMDHGALDGHVEDLFVRPAWRRKGVASSLLASLFTDRGRQGSGVAHVEVDGKNGAAIGLYKRFGFNEYGDGRMFLHTKTA